MSAVCVRKSCGFWLFKKICKFFLTENFPVFWKIFKNVLFLGHRKLFIHFIHYHHVYGFWNFWKTKQANNKIKSFILRLLVKGLSRYVDVIIQCSVDYIFLFNLLWFGLTTWLCMTPYWNWVLTFSLSNLGKLPYWHLNIEQLVISVIVSSFLMKL